MRRRRPRTAPPLHNHLDAGASPAYFLVPDLDASTPTPSPPPGASPPDLPHRTAAASPYLPRRTSPNSVEHTAPFPTPPVSRHPSSSLPLCLDVATTSRCARRARAPPATPNARARAPRPFPVRSPRPAAPPTCPSTKHPLRLPPSGDGPCYPGLTSPLPPVGAVPAGALLGAAALAPGLHSPRPCATDQGAPCPC